MTEKEIIERLMLKTEAVRTAQKYYFKNRNDVNKRASIRLEQELDNYLVELRRKGYIPEKQKDNSEQPKMF
jgi:hypothetical protein